MRNTSARRPAHRMRWAGPTTIVIAALIVAASAVAIISDADEPVAARPDAAQPSPAASAQEVSCAKPIAVRESDLCRTITVSGATYRYALLAPQKDKLRQLVIADPGGPGTSALADGGMGAVIGSLGIKDLPADTGFVLLEEPWVTRPAPQEECRRAASAFLEAARRGPLDGQVVAAMKRSCSAGYEYGWSPDRYRGVVAAVASQLGVPVTGFVGSSFGAYRLAWLLDDTRFRIGRAALSNPLLPELTAAEVMAHQAAGLGRIARTVSPEKTDVLAGDLLGAAAGQLPHANAANQVPFDLSTATAPGLTSLADTYIGRYGDNQLSLGRLAYYQELCAGGFSMPATSSWAGRKDQALEFLAALHSECPQPERPRVTLLDKMVSLCLVVSPADAVIPYARVRQLLGARSHHIARVAHDDMGGLRQCGTFLAG